MRYMIGSACESSLKKVQVHIPDVGMIITPSSWRSEEKRDCEYALDNGVWEAFLQNRSWDDRMHDNWTRMLCKVKNKMPLWVLLPDTVADWGRTVHLASNYVSTVRQKGFPVAIALQDGCNFKQVLDFSPDWVFVAGSDEWKDSNIAPACRYFHDMGIKVHVGRVNTMDRIKLCFEAGVDECDGTSLNRFTNKNSPQMARWLSKPCLPIFG